MKRVGVLLRTETISGVLKHYVRDALLNKLSNNDIEIICIPTINKLNALYNIIDSCNGIILPGGDDILDIDINIIDYLYKKNIPTLGICLGMQEMAIYKNGALMDLKTPKNHVSENNMHKILIKDGTLLYKIIKKNNIDVNSIHKSFVINTDLNISSISKDNIIESIEDLSKKFFLGVQWHPERMKEEEADLIFNYFINSL